MVKISASEELKRLNEKIKEDIRSLQSINKKRRLLLLEDDEIDAIIFKEIVKSYNDQIEVDHASDGEEGLKKLSGNPGKYTDVFVDLNMPIMDGFEFLREAKDIHHSNEVEVLVLTSSISSGDVEAVKRINQRITYLQKPINRDKLFRLFN